MKLRSSFNSEVKTPFIWNFPVLEQLDESIDFELNLAVSVEFAGILSEEVVSDFVVSDEVVSDFVVSDEVVSDEVVSDEVVSDEVVSDEVVSDEVVSDFVVSDEIVSDEVVSDLLLSSPSNFLMMILWIFSFLLIISFNLFFWTINHHLIYVIWILNYYLQEGKTEVLNYNLLFLYNLSINYYIHILMKIFIKSS